MDSSEILPPELARFWRTDDGLTACERAEAYGIDLSLLDENLRLTPAERLHQNDQALNLVEALHPRAGRARRLEQFASDDRHGQLDCLGEIKGIGGYAECVSASEMLEIDGATIRVLTLDALILAKRATGRPRHLHAVLELEAIRERLRR